MIIIGLRDQVGGDWWNYLYMFDRIKGRSLANAMGIAEPGYALLNWLAWKAGWGIWFPNLVCAAIFTWGLIAFCRLQPNPALALAVAVYLIILVGMGYTRQSAALGFVMLAATQHSKGALIKMAVSLTFAVAFHTSSAVMIPVFALALARRGFGAALTLAFVGLFMAYQLFGDMQALLFRYQTYAFTATGAVPRLLMNLIPALIFLTFPRRLSPDDTERRLWSIFSVLTLLSFVLLFFLDSAVIADRLGLYLTPLQIFVLSRVPAAFGTKSSQNLFLLTAILAYSLLIEIVWLSFGTWAHAWLPYRNYLWETVTERKPPRWFREVR